MTVSDISPEERKMILDVIGQLLDYLGTVQEVPVDMFVGKPLLSLPRLRKRRKGGGR